MRPLSHSSMSMYEECPRKYKFKYIEKVPEKPKHFFSFGKSLHEALEYFYGVPALPAPELKDVLAFYEQHWISEGYKDAALEEKYKKDGRKILTEFYDLHAPTFKLPMYVEYPFNIKVEGVAVTGVVDRIDRLDNGKLAILDYKTGKTFDIERVKESPQLTMYQMAVQESLGMEIESVTFYHLNSQTHLQAQPHGQDKVDALRKRIVGTAENILRARFDPKPDEWKCKWCDFRSLCPVFNGSPEPAPALDEQPLLTDKTEDELLAELVDRYGAAKDQAAQAEAEAARLEADITALLKKKGYMRAFGAKYEASLSPEPRWEFPDKNAFLEALKRLGLYERILKPSAPEVQKLLKDDKLPAAARRELEKLAKKAEPGPLRLGKLSDA